MKCKRCEEMDCVKSGLIRGKQRWFCKTCGCNFTEGDRRKERTTPQQRALAVLLVSLGLSYRAVGRMVGVVTNTVMVWFRKYAQSVDLPDLEGTVKVVDMEDMWQVLQKKKTSLEPESSHRLLLVQLDASMSKWAIVTLED